MYALKDALLLVYSRRAFYYSIWETTVFDSTQCCRSDLNELKWHWNKREDSLTENLNSVIYIFPFVIRRFLPSGCFNKHPKVMIASSQKFLAKETPPHKMLSGFWKKYVTDFNFCQNSKDNWDQSNNILEIPVTFFMGRNFPRWKYRLSIFFTNLVCFWNSCSTHFWFQMIMWKRQRYLTYSYCFSSCFVVLAPQSPTYLHTNVINILLA
jgi:hypothetical protein